MKITLTAIFLGVLIIFQAFGHSDAAFANRRETLRSLIDQLSKDYTSINKEIKELVIINTKDFPDTTLTISLRKGDVNLQLVSIELFEYINLIQNHIYTPEENRALDVGSVHQLFKGEVKKGYHQFKIIYYYLTAGNKIIKDEAIVNQYIKTGKNYLIELYFEEIKIDVPIKKDPQKKEIQVSDNKKTKIEMVHRLYVFKSR